MPFSLGSYLLGVGTVVGALAFGVGSGVLMTNTAVKETVAGPGKVERAARAQPEPAAAAQVANARENPAPPVEPAAAARADPVSAAQAETPKPDTRKEAERAREPGPPKQGDMANQTEPNQAGQREAEQKKISERRSERQKRYAERKARVAALRQKQRQFEEQEEPPREGFAFGREEPRFDLFQILRPRPFDRSDDMVPVERDD
jgi:hypothetical protein